MYDLDRKISDYFRADVKRVWVINPDVRVVRIHQSLHDMHGLIGDADLTDDDLLPGFRCPLGPIWALIEEIEPAEDDSPGAASAGDPRSEG